VRKSVDIILHEVLSTRAIADERMQGSETLNNFAESSDVLAGG